MKLVQARKVIAHHIETDEEENSYYIRHSANTWSVRMGESEESIYDKQTIEELETAFQDWKNSNQAK